MNIQRLHVGPRLSEVAIFNRTVYLAGQIAEDTSQDFAAQTREVLGHIDRLLEEAGSDKSQILMCQIYITDVNNMATMNEIWDAWVPAGNTPPRATVQAQLVRPELLIEIVVTAAQK
ncbi:RidA family protein [Undibacterium sp.]|jgi:enamine deaminase RidA (YjgF/YER057c/UK114 family)|uniref:RidA family protein n=1 Tax=Undibacterium sp. TaxID=1914977 RepID=UPI002BDB29DC|nr:RidA family protein [Undibacterium sp.]HTD06101.1 RidA family protein [Undibacterium sp.]